MKKWKIKTLKKWFNELAKKSVEKFEVKNDDVKNSEQVEVKDEVENSDIDLNKFSESEFKAFHKHLFLQMYNQSLQLVADLLNQNEASDEEDLKKLTVEIMKEKFDRLENYLD